MFKSGRKVLLTITTILMFITAACGADNATQESTIATAVAQTVAAQSASAPAGQPTETPAPALNVFPTQTPLQFIPTLTPIASAAPTLSLTSGDACAKAEMVSETVPDGTIYAPGAQFTKTWEIKNASLCTWDTSYKIVFWDGEVLGGAYVYNLPQNVAPGATVPISLVLTAPAATEVATHRSEWALQTPEGTNFGVGQYNAPFYVEIVVDPAEKPVYAVTSVDYRITRTPSGGCPANTTYTAYATITTNGPMNIKYRWIHSDGGGAVTGKLEFKEAGSQTVSDIWKIHLGSSPNDNRWFAIVIIEPTYKEFLPGIGFDYTCK